MDDKTILDIFNFPNIIIIISIDIQLNIVHLKVFLNNFKLYFILNVNLFKVIIIKCYFGTSVCFTLVCCVGVCVCVCVFLCVFFVLFCSFFVLSFGEAG